MMSEEDISYVCERGLGFYAAEPDNDDRSSDWSVVSGPGTPRSPSQNNLTGPEQCDFGDQLPTSTSNFARNKPF